MNKRFFKRVLDRGPEQRESKLIVLRQLIIIKLISYIIIKLLIMANHPSRNRKRNSKFFNVFYLDDVMLAERDPTSLGPTADLTVATCPFYRNKLTRFGT
jgi:hypothetical protein